MNISGTLIFAVTYFLISARRLSWLGLDRPAGALLGAVASVAFGALSPEAAINAIQGPTILLLFGVMGMGAFLALDGFFDHIERIVMRHAATRARLLALVVWGAGTLAAFITNDAVCLLGAPILVRLIERHRLPPLPFLLALATAANIGSVATLVGNPQNMLCAELGHLSYRAHLSLVGPLAVLCLGVNHSLLYAMFRRVLRNGPLAPLEQAPKNAPEPPSSVPRLFLTVAVVLATAIAYTLGANLAWSAATGFATLMILHRRDARLLWARIDGSLLLFFAALFIVVEALVQSGGPTWFFERFPLVSSGADVTFPGTSSIVPLLRTTTLFLIGANVVSNVPFIMVIRDQISTLPDPVFGWELLAVVSTFAGNLTLLGSVANIIVAERAHAVGGIGFGEYLKIGIPLTLITTLVGSLWLLAFAGS